MNELNRSERKLFFKAKITNELENYIFIITEQIIFRSSTKSIFLTLKKIEPFTNYQNENIRTGPFLYLKEL